MKERFDKLGRRIPDFDRSAASRKAAKTKKEKYGPDFYKRAGRVGGSRSKRGYFGRLKDEGKQAELQKIARKGAETANKIRANKSAVRGRSNNSTAGGQ